MLVSIALTVATVCTARACTKRVDEKQWPETRDETYWAETETYCSETETKPETHRSETERRPTRDRDVSTETTSLVVRTFPSAELTAVPVFTSQNQRSTLPEVENLKKTSHVPR